MYAASQFVTAVALLNIAIAATIAHLWHKDNA